MVAHVAGPAGGAPPPSRNEVLLREAVDRLRGELAACRKANDELAFAVRDLMDWAEHSHGGDPNLDPEEFYRSTEHARRTLNDYAMGGK